MNRQYLGLVVWVGCVLAWWTSDQMSQTRCEERQVAVQRTRIDLHQDPLPPGAIARMGSLRFNHAGNITGLCVSPDGKTLATGGTDRKVVIWDLPTGRIRWRFSLPDPARCLAISPLGKVLAVNWGELGIRMIDIAAEREVCSLVGHEKAVATLAFFPDGRMLVSGSGDGTIRFWDCADGRERRQLRPEGAAQVTSLAISADGTFVASGHADGSLRVWNVDTGKELHDFQKQKTKRNGPYGAFVESVAFSRDGKALAAGFGDGMVRVWDPIAGSAVGQFRVGKSAAHSVSILPDCKSLVWASERGIGISDIDTGQVRSQISHRGTSFLCLSPDGEMLASAGDEPFVRLWDLKNRKEYPRPPGHEASVGTVAFTASGKVLVTIGWDCSIRGWDVASGKQLWQERQGPGDVNAEPALWASCSPDGKSVYAALSATTLGEWETLNGRRIRTLSWGNVQITSCSLHPDGKRLVVETLDGEGSRVLRLCDTATGKELRSIPHPEGLHGDFTPVPGRLAWSPDGTVIAATDYDKAIHFLDVNRGKELRRIRAVYGPNSMVAAVAFSPNGAFLASCGGVAPFGGSRTASSPRENTIRLWDVASGRQLLQLPGHTAFVRSIAYSPDAKMLVSGSDDGTIRVWELASYKEIFKFHDFANPVSCVAISPHADFIASAMRDGNAYIWSLAPSEDLSSSGTIAGDHLARLWEHLAGPDTLRAYCALHAFAFGGDEAVAFLRDRLESAVRVSPERLREFILDLDSDNFARRERANEYLAGLGPQAEAVLRKVAAGAPSPEVRIRISHLLKALDSWAVTDPNTLRSLRSVWVLQRIGTPQARTVIKNLAGGAPEARITQEAQASLRFLDRNRKP
jgi:WD40 repeat protein